jgi:hypothetical protein
MPFSPSYAAAGLRFHAFFCLGATPLILRHFGFSPPCRQSRHAIDAPQPRFRCRRHF